MTERSERQISLRILDANANRCVEAIRTLEEIARFGLDDKPLAEHAKSLRHQIALSLKKSLNHAECVSERAVREDVGTSITLDSEETRADIQSILHAASSRLTESLRCLEEFSKLHSVDSAKSFESLRYDAYQLTQQLIANWSREKNALHDATIYVLADCDCALEEFVARTQRLEQNGIRLLQIRDKHSDDRKLLAYTKAAKKTLDHTKVIVNDRPDIAMIAGADGVHLGQQDLPVRLVRTFVRRDMIIGVSTHNLEQAKQAVRDRADYIGCGPTFPSKTKTFESFSGLEFLRAVAADSEISVPKFAIGGISTENADKVRDTGFHRVAVQSAIWNSLDAPASICSIRELLNQKRQ